MILLAYITIGHPRKFSLIPYKILRHMILSFVHHPPSIDMLLPNFRRIIIIIIKLYPHVKLLLYALCV